MRWMPLALMLLLPVLTIGCASIIQPSSDELVIAEPDTNIVGIQSAHVFVDGRHKGATPSTVQVRRGFNEALVTLRIGEEVVRAFEIESADTYNKSELEYSFSGGVSEGVLTYDVTDLNQTKNGVHLIPYFSQAVQIEDRDYGLVLIVIQ